MTGPASAMSAFGQDAEERLEAKPASAVGEAETPIFERMIQHQMSAYPEVWSQSDKREMAILHLFGEQSE